MTIRHTDKYTNDSNEHVVLERARVHAVCIRRTKDHERKLRTQRTQRKAVITKSLDGHTQHTQR